MSTAPSFDPNHRPKNIAELATNRCTRYAYEPGSTFKMITASAAIENVADWRSKHFYCNGVQLVGHHQMHCWINSTSQRRHGDENLADSIRDSCNFGMYGFARLVGAPTMLAYAKNFGLHSSVDIPGLGGPNGYLARNNPNDWSPEQLANFSFGQGMTLTPLQLARVVCTIANDGVMMKPMIVREVRDEQNKVVRAFAPQVDHRVIKVSTAHIVRDMMERVLSEGSASKSAWVPGYMAAGKTGSAQKADGVHGYATGKFISSLVGFIPSHQPRYAILVMADEPHGSHWGSEVCGPAWSGIARRAMLHLRLRDGASAPAPDPRLMKAPGKKPGEH
jgi:cell division protein FtsI/penicillin-binding protein 2